MDKKYLTILLGVMVIGLSFGTLFVTPVIPPIEYREYNCTQWLFGDEYIDMCRYLAEQRQHGGYNCQLVGCPEEI